MVEHRAAQRTIRRRAVLLKIEWQIVVMQRYEGVREYFSHVREAFVVEVVEVVKFGERGVKQG